MSKKKNKGKTRSSPSETEKGASPEVKPTTATGVAPVVATKAEAKKPDPVKVEEKKPDPVKVEAKKPDPVKVEAKKPDPVKVEAKKPDPVKVEEKKPEPVKVEEKKPDPVKVEEKKPEPVKVEEKKPEPVKAEEKKPEPIKVEEKKPEPVKAEEKKPEPVKVEEKKPEPAPAANEAPQKAAAPKSAFERLDSKVRYSVVLTGICLASVFLVMGVLAATDSTIKDLKAKGEKAALAVVLGVPADSVDSRYRSVRADEGFPVDAKIFGDPLEKAAFQFKVKGYSGDLAMIVGVEGDKILGLAVPAGGHNETPGLGARIDEVKAAGTVWESAMADPLTRNVVGSFGLLAALGLAWLLIGLLRARRAPLHPNIRPDLIHISLIAALSLAAFAVSVLAFTSKATANEASGPAAAPRPWFQDQFSKPQRTKAILVIKKTEELGQDYVAAISGSTITTTAVVKGLEQILDAAMKLRGQDLHEKLLQRPLEGGGEETQAENPAEPGGESSGS